MNTENYLIFILYQSRLECLVKSSIFI